jgi:hypothetical protein
MDLAVAQHTRLARQPVSLLLTLRGNVLSFRCTERGQRPRHHLDQAASARSSSSADGDQADPCPLRRLEQRFLFSSLNAAANRFKVYHVCRIHIRHPTIS